MAFGPSRPRVVAAPRFVPLVASCTQAAPLGPRRATSARLSAQMWPKRLQLALLAFCARLRKVVAVAFALLLTSPLPLVVALPSIAIATEAGIPLIRCLPEARRLVPASHNVRRVKSSFVTAAVDSVGPSVVRIDTERFVDRPPLENALFPGLEPEGPRREAGQGSGVILSKDGLILTNAHVVKNAAKVTVTLTDGRVFEGCVRGFDEHMDLAAVKITPIGRRLPTAPLGRSDELQVGDWVIAIGNAVGLDSTVTLGIVSSLQRSAAEAGIPNKKVNFIQTDAAINPGNSGGPLLNEFGQVVGINTAIRANAAGIGFAIPIDTAEKAMRELSEGRNIAHAYLGISMSSLTTDSAKQNNADPKSNVELPELPGALVLAVAPETPAAKAGFRKFDLIQEIGGKQVKSASDAQAVVDAAPVGKTLTAKIVRQRKTITLSVVTADLSERFPCENARDDVRPP